MVEVNGSNAAKLAKRREYYKKNRDYIRNRDNANARKRRAEDPEKYQQYLLRWKEKAAANPVTFSEPLTIEGHPDCVRIIRKIILDWSIIQRNGVEVSA